MKSINEHFNIQVKKTPNKQVIFDEHRSINYKELDSQSTLLSQLILSQKCNPKTSVIGVYLTRSINLVVSLLATLKSGGIYLPLDPKEPKVRIENIISNSNCKLVITDKILFKKNPWLGEHNTILIDNNNNAQGDSNLKHPFVTLNNSAYIMYTTGSTGIPKGVICKQRAIVNRFEWYWKHFPYTPNEVCCQKASISYVDSIWELLCPLLKGIPYHIVPDAILHNMNLFLNFLNKNKITRIELAPSLLNIMLKALEKSDEKLPHLKHCVVSGEQISVNIANQFKKQIPNVLLLNRYGLTEASSFLWYLINHWDEKSKHIPIGKPIDNVVIYVLDSNMKEVRDGSVGELYVGGDCLSEGYIKHNELNQCSFIKNPFQDGRYDRLYGTGDLVRRLSTGNIEYIAIRRAK